MVYKVIGIMSGSSLDGMDIAFTELREQAGAWQYEIQHATCIPYNEWWFKKLQGSITLPAKEYLLLHAEYGQFIGQKINEFIDEKNLQHQVSLICSHGHTTFHLPEKKMTHQLGDGSAIAARTGLPVVTDLRSLDVAFGGQGAPIVPLGEKLLFNPYNYFLNIGGIANISVHKLNEVIAFDVCAANRVLNMLAEKIGLAYDDEGRDSSRGSVNEILLEKLNSLEYYKLPSPKSLANTFSTDTVYP
ncbi:MAG: anhydro-N-acetylmuramic acid kinase, partial [Ginsengibacter sp.]